MWPVQHQRLDQIGPMSHMGPGLKKWLVQYLRLDQIGPMSYMGPGPISDIGPGPMWHMGLAYYWQVRVQEGGVLRPRPREGGDDCCKRGDVVRYSSNS